MNLSVGAHFFYHGVNPEIIIPAESRVHHIALSDGLMVVAEHILLPALVLVLVLGLAPVFDEFREAGNWH